MVVSKPSETSTSDLRNDSNNDQRSDKSSLIENNPTGISEQQLGIEKLTNDAQEYSSMSARSNASNLYRNRDETNNDSCRSQRNAFVHLYSSGMSCENSPKSRVELQPLSPSVALNNSPCNKYRPYRGVILQNLSSGSEAESNYDVMSSRIVSNQNSDRLIPPGGLSPDLAAKSCKIENVNRLPSTPLSSRRSSNHTLVNSSRNDYFEGVLTSPVSRMNFADGELAQSLNDPLTSVSSLRKIPREKSFYRFLDSSRSECNRNTKDRNVDEPLFFSAREGIRNYNRDLETPPSPSESPICDTSKIAPQISETVSMQNSPHNMVNLQQNSYNESTRRSYEKVFDQREQTMTMNEYLNSSNSKSRGNENRTPNSIDSTPNTLRSPENILEKVTFEHPLDNESEYYSLNIRDSKVLKQAISKCILNYNDDKDAEFLQSQDITPSSQFNPCANESQSAVSTSREFFVGEFAKMFEENFTSQESNKNNQDISSQHSNNIISDREFTNIPTLVLNSREMSYSTSPASKVYSNRYLDADALTLALSDAFLKQQTTRISSENTCSESNVDSKTISKPESSENLSTNHLESKSFNLYENQSRLTTSRTSCRSFLSMRSKIPVKIPTNRSKLSIVSKVNETEKRGVSPIDGQAFESNPSSPEALQFTFTRSKEVSESCESLPSLKNDVEKSDRLVSRSSVNTDSKDQYSDRRSTKDKTENLETSGLTLKDVVSKTCLSLQIHISDDDRLENKKKGENQNYGDGDCANYNVPNSINQFAIDDTFRSPKFSNSPKKYERNNSERSISSESESDSSPSPCYNRRQSLKKLQESEEREEPEECEEPNRAFIPTIPSIDYPVENYQGKYLNNTYEGEVLERLPEKRKPNVFLPENQIGDGDDIFLEGSEKLKFERISSSPEGEEFMKSERVSENHDKLQFSLEKLAADQFRRSISSEQTKTIQSDTTAFFAEKFHQIPQFSLACSSSTSKLRNEKCRDSPRFKKKSQDRFPFTISEKTSVASMKFKIPSRLDNLDEDKEDSGYKLDTHPSITRLAGSGYEDSPADIINYVAKTELEDRRIKSSGMKGLVKKFSARLKKSQKRDDDTEPNLRMTNVIYKNRDYRDECESSAESCSESSLLSEFKINESMEENLCETKSNFDSPEEKSIIVCDRKSLENSHRESIKNTPLSNEKPCRRYDRDDLWVQAFKDFDSDREERKENVKTSKNEDESKKDPYSVFFVKSARETSIRAIASEDEEREQVSSEKKKNRVKFHGSSLTVAPKISHTKEHKKPTKNRSKSSERVRQNKNMQSGCLCLRFYRMIVPISFGSISKYRSRTNNNSSVMKKRSRVSSQKRKG